MNIFIKTDRFILREIEESDLDAMFQLDNDPEVHQYLGNNPINNKEQALAVIQFIRNQYQENEIGRWAVVEKATNNFVGWSGFKLITEPTNEHVNYLDFGYRFIRSVWGNGYATECGLACMAYAKTFLKEYDIHAMADQRNIASKKVLEKIGFEATDSFVDQQIPCYWFDLKLDF